MEVQRWSLDSSSASAFYLTPPPTHHLLAHQPKDDRPVLIMSRRKDVLCIYFLSHYHPFVNVIALVWNHTFQLQKIVSF